MPFFSWVGLRCPERKNIADFVQEVCSEKDQEVSTGSLSVDKQMNKSSELQNGPPQA